MLLSVENLKVSYGKIRALHGISFQIAEGERVCIIGANGAGKSTALRAVSRLVPVEAGTKMTYMGEDLLKYPADKVVSQAWHFPCSRGEGGFSETSPSWRISNLPPLQEKTARRLTEDIQRVFSIFPRLEERKTQKAGTLSGGEQQMLAIGRAFMSGRKIMLLDEPSMGLAPLLMMNVFEALTELNAEGTTILLVEQNARMALQFAQRGYVLENGSLVLEGPLRISLKTLK